MKRSLVLAWAMLGSMNAHARAEVVWVGEVIVKSPSPGCSTEWLTGDFGSSIFRPVIPGSGENGTVSRMVFSGKNTVIVYEVNAEFSGNVAYNATLVSPSGIVSTFTSAGGIQNATISPAQFSANTQALRVRGKFTRFDDIAGCNVNLDGVYVKQP
jgi:hypothetical protein